VSAPFRRLAGKGTATRAATLDKRADYQMMHGVRAASPAAPRLATNQTHLAIWNSA
jgi:hypothetical protein